MCSLTRYGGNSLYLCLPFCLQKGRWHAQRDGGVADFYGKIPAPSPPFFAPAPHSRHHLRESARFPRATMFARAMWQKRRGGGEAEISPKQAIKKSRRYIELSAAHHIFYNPSASHPLSTSLYTREAIQGKARADFDIRKSSLFRSAGVF